MNVKGTEQTADLLSLIGKAIDELRLSIGRFEAADQQRGLEHLATVVGSIDAYLDHLESDPLLLLAPIPPGDVRASLHHIRDDLNQVIRGGLAGTPG